MQNVYRNTATGKLICEVEGAIRAFARSEGDPPHLYTMEEGDGAAIDPAACAYVGEVGRHFRMEGGKLVDALAESRPVPGSAGLPTGAATEKPKRTRKPKADPAPQGEATDPEAED